MLSVRGIEKSFVLKNAKQMQQFKRQDPRICGRRFKVLDGVSLTCQAGEVVALLGANGAGKTSLLRVLSTALKAQKGRIQCNQADAQKNLMAYRRQIGFLSGTTGLYERLSGEENLRYFAKLYGLDAKQQSERIAHLSEQLAMQNFLKRRFGDYSTGMKQRVSIARALLHDPQFLILDEPTTGLDIKARGLILNFIAEQRAAGKGIIFSTHDMAEVNQLCQRICILRQGQVVFNDSEAVLLSQTGQTSLAHAVLAMIGD
ncbi:ATP-binding cassette domain-containing protein [Gayadomonas joobiniege]|uniref:ABC transporter ATP-binding protein n=1 Tax=Gayadomonas joobiniege TaxID=1234606 RepID=UPI00036932CA|nr:ABC transporter ATP-binding protein [Gayadomonas joobiniege]